jgi:hypothetical protein
MSAAASPSMGPLPGEAIESKIALDMVKRSVPFVPVLLLLSALIWGRDGAISAGLALALVLTNFLLAAALLGWAARISIGAIMGAALFGYLLRLVLIAAVVLPLRNQPWFSPWALGVTLVVSHLGLLLWELRHVSIKFSQSGVAPSGRHRSVSVNNTVSRSES